ncbi:AGRE1 protein, partial [Atractosteus spatula]|nr:AGRE1 protein [Atractosteus spatula]
MNGEWYRFEGLAGDILPTNCITSYHCGAPYPIWMNGNLPQEGNGSQVTEACIYYGSVCCYWRQNMEVKACPGGYYVYSLPKPVYIYSTYCSIHSTCSPSACGTNSQCDTDTGRCSCNNGYKFPDTFPPANNSDYCEDIDECKENSLICGSNAECTNNAGSYTCSCYSGYTPPPGVTLTNQSWPCKDIDECAQSPPICGPNAQCTNSVGSYSCACDTGFIIPTGVKVTNNSHPCQDIHECDKNPSICGPYAECINTPGKYNCSCNTGYRPPDGVTMTKINECTEDPSICGPSAECTNTAGSYNCSCDLGYGPGAGVTLINIDECLQSPPICGPNALCNNTPGSYKCSCKTGFRSKLGTSITSINQCQDIDECEDDPSVCGSNANCTNTAGSYICSCHSGYSSPPGVSQVNKSHPCQDTDECTQVPLVCGPNSNCANSNGSYNCSCWNGYKAQDGAKVINDNNPCQDIDECAQNSSICGLNTMCYNNYGGFDCSCKEDYLPSPGLEWEFGKTQCLTWICIFYLQTKPKDFCFLEVLRERIKKDPNVVLPLENVKNYLDIALRSTEMLASQDEKLKSQAFNSYVKSSEVLVSTLVDPETTEPNKTVKMESLEIKCEVHCLKKIQWKSIFQPLLITIMVSCDVSSASAVFISYTGIENLLRADYLKTDNVTEMLSDVISATLAKTINTNLSEPVSFTLKHTKPKSEHGVMTCVYWKDAGEEQFWSVEGCTAKYSNENYTICSCTHLSTFALIMQLGNNSEKNPVLDFVNNVAVILGLVFLALAIMTFIFCRWNPKINNTTRLNLCVCLFLAQLLFLVGVPRTEIKIVCSIIAGVLHFLFLASFVWMLLEAVQLFLLVRSLAQVRIIQKEGLRSAYLLLIGYGIPTVVVGVSAGLFPKGYGDDKQCWLKNEKGFRWTFLGPLYCILALNLFLFSVIVWNLRLTLVHMKSDISKVNDTRIILFKSVAQCVVLGCGWILGFFQSSTLLTYLFIVLNSQQGTFIFIVHCLLNREVTVLSL